MAQGEFSLKRFVLEAPNELLRQHLARHKLGANLPWSSYTEVAVDPLVECIQSAPDKVRDAVEGECTAIFDMATDAGAAAIIQEADDHHHLVNVPEHIAQSKGHLHTAYWAFLECPVIFGNAAKLHRATAAGWSLKRAHLPSDMKPDISKAGAKRLGAALCEYHMSKEGRGRLCVVDHLAKDGLLYWFAYPEDFAREELGYAGLDLVSSTRRHVLERVFVLDLSERTLKINVRRQVLGEELQRVFGRAILGLEIEPERKRATYQLTPLLRRNFPFASDPEDGVLDVRLLGLRVELMGLPPRTVAVEVDDPANPTAIWDLLDEVLGAVTENRSLSLVKSATIRLTFTKPGKSKPGQLTFRVAHPRGCTLRDTVPHHRLAARLLKKWGLDVSDRPEGASGAGGEAFQTVARP